MGAMTARHDDADDDPTRALDGFLQRLHAGSAPPGRGPEDALDLSALSGLLHADRALAGQAEPATSPPRVRTLRNGERWQADDVTDVPVVELPRVAPGNASATVDDEALLNDIGREVRAAAASAASASSANAAPDWQPDLHALQRRPARDPRVLQRWQPGAWIGAQRPVLQASTEFVTPAGAAPGAAPVVESYDAQRLLVLWAPPSLEAPHPGRWPRQVLLAPVGADAAADALLAARPTAAADAPLWLDPDPDHVDWALAAEIALHHVAGLRPFQIDGLRAFIAGEREASFGRVNEGYGAAGGGVVQASRDPGRAA